MRPLRVPCVGQARIVVGWVASQLHAGRSVSTFGDDGVGNSILGTSSMSASFLKDLQEDLQREQDIRKHGIGETLTNYVRRAELSHMESPEEDKKFLQKFGSQVDDFFSKIPLPEDPMKAALARTPEELEEEAAAEMLREAVREAYLRKLDAKAAEELRLKQAARRLEKHGYQAPTEEERRWEPEMSAAAKVDAAALRAAVAAAEAAHARRAAEGGGYQHPVQVPSSQKQKTFEEEMEAIADGIEEGALMEELQAMQKKMKMMEALLDSKKSRRAGPKDENGS